MTIPDRRPNSSHWGAFLATNEKGRVTRTEPFPGDPHPSPILDGIPDAVHHDVRVRAPAVRASWISDGPGAAPTRRGVDPFVEVTWDEALDLVAGELRRVRDEHGATAIFGGSYGWASAGRFHHARTQLARFLNLIGGSTLQEQNYSYAAAMTLLPYVLGTADPISGGATALQSIEEHTDLWIQFGGLPLRNAQIEPGGVGHHNVPDRIRRIASAGVRCVAVTPDGADVPSVLGAEQLSLRPGTDTALMLALAHTLFVRGLADDAFLQRYCVGGDRWRDYVLGNSDGVPKDADWAARICDIPATRIRDLAVAMSRSRTMIGTAWALQRADHGEQPIWATIALACTLGQIGLPGGGFSFGYGDAAGIGLQRNAATVPYLSAGRNPVRSTIPVARIADMLLNPGGAYEYAGQHRRYPEARLVYWAGGNPFHHHQDLNRLALAWQRPETIVVHEPWWTATARRADIVLPATTTLERVDLGSSNRDRHVIAMHRVVPPIGDARDDHEIFRSLAVRLGVEHQFTEGRSSTEWVRHMYEQTREHAARLDHELPEFADFWEAGSTELPQQPPLVLLDDFRRDPAAHPLATPSGRIELYSEAVASFRYDDCPGHPVWRAPVEWLGSPLAERFPLHLLSGQPATRLHSQLDMAGPSRASKVDGREPCRIARQDALQRGIADGDIVRIFNDRGACLSVALVTDELRPGVIALPTGAWFDPEDPQAARSLEKHGNPNVLTPDRGTSRLSQGPSAHSTLVDVERFAGTAPPVTVHVPPEIRSAR